MTAVYLLALAVVLAVHGLAIALLLQRWFSGGSTALAAALVVGVALLFAVEHAQGLGALRGLAALSTLGAVSYLAVHRQSLQPALLLRQGLPLGLGIALALLWRSNFPSMYPSSERVTDLYFIVNYLPGATLPPVDHWFPPYRFDFYYALQHYAAALFGRWFGLGPGLTYNLAFALLAGLTIAVVWELYRQQGLRRPLAIFLLAVVVVGGTGASVWTRLVAENTEAQPNNVSVYDRMAGSARFIGNFDQRINTPLGRAVFGTAIDPERPRLELPLENFGYQFYLGDYHPPLGGFFLLALALALMWQAQQATAGPRRDLLLGLLAATAPLTLAVNTWVFPLHALMVGSWALWQCWHAASDRAALRFIAPLLVGGLVALLLLLPFLAGFTQRSFETPMAWVQPQQRTPLVSFLALHAPVLLLLALSPWVAARLRPYAWPLALALLGGLVASELVFMDDLSGNEYERTNTTMKWWGWIWTAALMGLAPAVLLSQRRWVTVAAAIGLASTLTYALDIVQYWRAEARSDRGQLHGEAIYRRDAGGGAIIDFLKAAPRGIVVERLRKHAYDDAGIYSALAAQPLLLGWPLHEVTWRGQLHEIWQRREALDQLYAGTHPAPADWLMVHEARYVVWSVREAADLAPQREVLDRQLHPHYVWRELGRWGDRPVGLWVRREP